MKELVQYVKRDFVENNSIQRKKVGMFIARREANGQPTIYWSKVNVKAGDKFDLVEGRNAALNHTGLKVPSKFKKFYEKFQDRCKRYFKEDTVLG